MPAQIDVVSWEEVNGTMREAALLVNTTSLGMKGQPPLEIALDALPREACVYDIVYSPLMTQLLLDAKARGHRIITGLGMLLYQAQPAFEVWFGIRPEVNESLNRHMLEGMT